MVLDQGIVPEEEDNISCGGNRNMFMTSVI